METQSVKSNLVKLCGRVVPLFNNGNVLKVQLFYLPSAFELRNTHNSALPRSRQLQRVLPLLVGALWLSQGLIK
jgi:hypothetical protein